MGYGTTVSARSIFSIELEGAREAEAEAGSSLVSCCSDRLRPETRAISLTALILF